MSNNVEASHHLLSSSAPSSFSKAQNNFLLSQQSIKIQNYQNVLGLLLKTEVLEKGQRKRRENRDLFGPLVHA